jgi:hypothetical protein
VTTIAVMELDLRPFRVVARRMRDGAPCSAGIGLKSSPATAFRAVFGPFVVASRKVCVVGAKLASQQTTQYADLQGFLRERRDSNPRPPA